MTAYSFCSLDLTVYGIDLSLYIDYICQGNAK